MREYIIWFLLRGMYNRAYDRERMGMPMLWSDRIKLKIINRLAK